MRTYHYNCKGSKPQPKPYNFNKPDQTYHLEKWGNEWVLFNQKMQCDITSKTKSDAVAWLKEQYEYVKLISE